MSDQYHAYFMYSVIIENPILSFLRKWTLSKGTLARTAYLLTFFVLGPHSVVLRDYSWFYDHSWQA